jgi:hypothetical protein
MIFADTFIAYVNKTSRTSSAQSKRRSMLAGLDAQMHPSVNSLVGSVDGNSKDHAWVARAIKDGIIKRDGGVLKLGDGSTRTGAHEPILQWPADWDWHDRVQYVIWNDNDDDGLRSKAVSDAVTRVLRNLETKGL